MGSKSQSHGQQQQTSTQALDPQIKDSLLGNYGSVQNLVANTPSQYNGQLVAGFDPAQTQAQSGLINLANSGIGNSELNQATTAAGGVASFAPSQVTAGSIPNIDLSKYLNPGTQDVINTTMADLNRQNQITNSSNDAQATQAGAFGGDRSAVQNALTNEAYARTGAQTYAGLNQANYDRATGLAQGDIANQLSAAQGNQNAGIAGAGLNLQGANSLAAMSGQKVGQATALQQLLASVGAQRQGQAQAGLDASRNQFQTNLGNKISLQQLINQALGLAGNPALTQSQGSGSNSSFTMGINGVIPGL